MTQETMKRGFERQAIFTRRQLLGGGVAAAALPLIGVLGDSVASDDMETSVISCRYEGGDVIVAALGRSAIACMFPFVDSLESTSYSLKRLELRQFERRSWPVSGKDVAVGQAIVSLDVLMNSPELVSQVPKDWIWIVVADENSDEGDLKKARDILGEQAAMLMATFDPTGPGAPCLRGRQTSLAPAARLLVDAVLHPEAFSVASRLSDGRWVSTSMYAKKIKPRPECLTVDSVAEMVRYWLPLGGRMANRYQTDFEFLVAVQPTRTNILLPSCENIVEERHVGDNRIVRGEGRWVPGPVRLESFCVGETEPDWIERLYLFRE